MKRLSFSFILLAIVSASYIKAQTDDVQPIINYNILENKFKKSNAAIEDHKKNTKAKTWITRGELMMERFAVNLQYIRMGMPVSEAKLFFREPDEIKQTQDGADTIEEYVYKRINLTFKNGTLDDWVETGKIHENPLPEAKKSFEKVIELDTEGKFSEDLKEKLNLLKIQFESEAVYTYNKDNFEGAYFNFGKILEINEIELMGGVIDTVIFYNSARVASELEKFEDAIELFEVARGYDYNNPFLYIFLNNCYNITGDTASGVEVLKDGFRTFPENQSILIELINYYLLTGIADEALEYLAIAKEDDPENISFYFAEGTLYDKLERFDDAKRSYEYCLELDENYFNAYYNLGVLYYNYAVKLYDEANKINDIQEYNKAKAVADEEIVKALPYIEKAHEINPDDLESLKTLKTLYYRLGKDVEYDVVVIKLKEKGIIE